MWISTWITFVPVRIANLLSQKYTQALHERVGWVELGLALLFSVCKRQRQMFQLRTCWELLRQCEGGRKCQMLICFFLQVVWGILWQAITIAVRFFMSVCNLLCSLIAFTSLAWLYHELLAFVEAFHGVCSVEGYQICWTAGTINLLLNKKYPYKLGGQFTKWFHGLSGTTNAVLLAMTSAGYGSFCRGDRKCSTGKW